MIAPEPQRRRVRRKTAGSAVETEVVTAEAVEAVAPPLEPEIAFVEAEPETAPVAAEPVPESVVIGTETLVTAEASVAPAPEADLSAIIANDPNQITAPPAKPKRGWWRL